MWEPPPPPDGEEAAGEADGDSEAQAGTAWEELPAEQRLGEVLEHLRRRHAYCLFCGCQVAQALFPMLLPCSACVVRTSQPMHALSCNVAPCACAQYRDEDDLAEACPGKWEDDH
jgi:hypothetical protein